MPKHKPREPQSKQSKRGPEAFDRLMRKIALHKPMPKPKARRKK